MKYLVCTFALLLLSAGSLAAQTTAFSYQGKLTESGSPVNGTRQMTFSLWTAATEGSQIGSSIGPMTVNVSGGIFSVALDFGNSAFSGNDLFLNVNIGGSDLTPRSPILSAPYSVRSASAGFATSASNATNAAQLGGVPASQYLQTGGAPVTGDIQFTGNLLLAPAGPIASAGGSPPSTLYAVNPTPGINNPSPTNLPPAAVRGDATSTSNGNAGVIGIADGAIGVGVAGLARTAGGTGVVAISSAATGDGVGLSADTFSPDGTAVSANMPTGGSGFLIHASSNEIGRFSVTSSGQVQINGSINLSGNQQISGNLSVTAAGGGSISANNLFISGTKNNVVTLNDGKKVLFYANESPEYWFEDFGTITLKNGRAVVKIDPTFAESTNTAIEYKVFLTPNGNSRGLFVTRKTATSFEVRESRGGRSSISFDYRIVAKRRGYENERFGPAPK